MLLLKQTRGGLVVNRHLLKKKKVDIVLRQFVMFQMVLKDHLVMVQWLLGRWFTDISINID